MFDTVVIESEELGLSLNNRSTEVMVVSKTRFLFKCSIKVNCIRLGTCSCSNGRKKLAR